MKQLIHVFFICLLCTSCSLSGSKTQLQILGKDAISLTGIPVYSDSILWGSNLIDFMDGKLVNIYYKKQPFFWTYRLDGDSLLYENRFLYLGEGPNEMLYPSCHSDQTNQQFFFYGMNGGQIDRFYKISARPFSNLYNPESWENMVCPQRKNFYWSMQNNIFALLNDSTVVGLGGDNNGSNLLSMFTFGGDTIIDLPVSLPDDRNTSNPMIRRFVYNEGAIRKRESANQILYHCYKGNYAEIITFGEDYTTTRKVLVNDYPLYKTAKDGFNRAYLRDCLMGLKAYTTDRFIYLFSCPFRLEEELKHLKYKEYPPTFNDYIYVFDWEGNYVKSYFLDTPIDYFVVNQDDSFLLGSTCDLETGDYYVKKFSLNQ